MSTGNKSSRGWYARLAAFNVASLFTQAREPGPPRTIYVNESLPDHCIGHKGKPKPECVYTTNQVITSKYTIITFFPRNLLEQFRRVANLFFLVISILQFFPKFSTISPGVAILPLIVIVTITALKDGYEDVKRHEADKRVNHSTVKVLAGSGWRNENAMQPKNKTFVRGIAHLPRRRPKSNPSAPRPDDSDTEDEGESSDGVLNEKSGGNKPNWKRVLWEDLKVGDFVKIRDKESIPADIMICATSEEEDVAFVETKNLDGETNLKSRHAVASLSHLRTAQRCADPQNSFRVNCDRPDVDMYRLQANVTTKGETSSVDLSMTLLRGTVLRNTRWAVGVVMFTGLDTKIMMNSGGTPSKRSKVERQMNIQVFVNLIILAIMAICCAIADSLLQVRYYPLDAPWLYGANLSDDNPRINGLITWVYSLLTFQIIVPISLYISIEFVRTCQAAFIYFDGDIWYAKTNQATICRSWNLSDDLGQIEYIFSDKTGTLTQNLMVFRQCSIGGRAYRGDTDMGDDGVSNADIVKPASPINSEEEIKPVAVSVDIWSAARSSSSNIALEPVRRRHSSKEEEEKSLKLMEKAEKAEIAPMVRFKDTSLTRDMVDAMNAEPESDNATHYRLLNGFFTVLALCHTVLTSVDPTTGEIEYKAQSPDEAALVQAAADVGFVFCGRDKETLTLRTPATSPEVEKYELLNILEFTSARKRMSVVVRKLGGEDNRLFLLTKGADNIIFQRLRESERDLMQETEVHLNEFANSGLRTLTLAYKVIPEAEYQAWNERYHEASVSLEDREARIESISNELEQDLRLLGATAIEDRLQDGVPETIADLKKAGIRIWVATGDKLETAIAIGRSTNLVASDSNIIIIRGDSRGRTVHQQMTFALDKFFPESNGAVAGTGDLPRPSTASREPGIPLQRINTGASIVGSMNGELPGGFVLVIDGAALLDALDDEENKSILLRLAMMCEAVICCRVSPLQKALVVRLVKDGLGVMTLAIGDGANDVSMIQAADVGIGISGEEGLQAVNSSDYAIAQFRFLKKLLLVHGHWSYARNGTMILNFFYKNVVPVGVLWWFQIYDGWSANFVFDYIYILFWNSIWTIAPVVGIGLFDRILDSHVLMAVPELYHYGRNGTWFGLRSFFIYLLDGVYQSVIIFFLILYTYNPSTTARRDGYSIYLEEFSTTMAIAAVMIANIFTGFSATAWSAWIFFAVFIGILIVWLFTIIYSIISPGYAVTALYGNYYILFTSAYFWLCIPLIFTLSLTPRLLARAWKFGFTPDDLDTMRWVSKYEPGRDFSLDAHYHTSSLKALRRSSTSSRRNSRLKTNNDSVATLEPRPSIDPRSASRTDMATGVVSIDRGFDFATEEHGVAMRRMQSNLSEKRVAGGQSSRHQRSLSRKGKETFSHMLKRGLLKTLPSPRKSE